MRKALAIGLVALILTVARSALACGPTPTATMLIVTDNVTNAVLGWHLSDTGNVAPFWSLSGNLTTLSNPVVSKEDATGNLYVLNRTPKDVCVWLRATVTGAGGNVAPDHCFHDSSSDWNFTNDLAIDHTGQIYVSTAVYGEGTVNNVYVYPAGASGNTAPTYTISGGNTGFANPGLSDFNFDSTNELIVSNTTSIELFPYGTNGNASPATTITGAGTGINQPGLTTDSAHNIWAANSSSNSITEYAAGSSGNTSPTVTITGSHTHLGNDYCVALDSAGNIYATNATYASVTGFAVGSSGNANNLIEIGGNLTAMNTPIGILAYAPGGHP